MTAGTTPLPNPDARDREDVEFTSEGTTCRAWFYPATAQGEGGRPITVMAHGLAGTRDMRLDAYAEVFQAHGYNVLLFDYRFWGDSDGQPRDLMVISDQLRDWEAAIDFARSLPGVDASSLILWGSSLSGGHVITLGARHPEAVAVIAQVPHLDGLAASRLMPPLTSLAIGASALYDIVRRRLGRSPYYVKAAAQPGQVALMTSPDAEPGMRRMTPAGKSYRSHINAGAALQVGSYFPVRSLKRLTVPTLVQVCLEDEVTPPEVAVAADRHSPGATVKTYQGRHFDPYVEPMFHTVVADQLVFIDSVLADAR